jgi:hypothetical protein
VLKEVFVSANSKDVTVTLILTELSPVGIVMVADSAISYRGKGSRTLRTVDREGWPKLLRVPRIKAAISYWGEIGRITQKQFDLWLKDKVVDSANYTDLPSLADHISGVLNEATNNKPLPDGYDIGIHVAGYHQWTDGVLRPTFFHVHNGHGEVQVIHRYQEINGKKYLTEVHPAWKSGSRELFAKYQDFPWETNTVEQNLQMLKNTYRTRNGDYYIYSVMSQQIEAALNYIGLIPGISIPRDPNNLPQRKAVLVKVMETVIWIYANSSSQSVVGGKLSSLAIGPTGYLLPLDKNIS